MRLGSILKWLERPFFEIWNVILNDKNCYSSKFIEIYNVYVSTHNIIKAVEVIRIW